MEIYQPQSTMSATEPTTYTCNASDIEMFELISNGIESFDLSQKASNIKPRVLELLQGGANPNARVPADGPTVRIACMNHPYWFADGPTVLIACVNNPYGFVDFSVAELLLEWGADPMATYQDKTALDRARPDLAQRALSQAPYEPCGRCQSPRSPYPRLQQEA